MVDMEQDRDSYAASSGQAALEGLWRHADMPEEALAFIKLKAATSAPLPSSFALGQAAQATIGAAALAATELGAVRGARRQRVEVDMRHAAEETRGYFRIDGHDVEVGDKLTGLYECGDGRWVRIHANFAHHRDGALTLLGARPGPNVTREEVTRLLRQWNAEDFEHIAADKGLPVVAMRSFAQWDAHPQGLALRDQPPFTIERIGEAPPRPVTRYVAGSPLLAGLRVLDLTRIIAGPVAGRTLAAYGADVMLVNSPLLPNIEAIAETSRGKLSAHIDLDTADGRIRLGSLLRSAHVFSQAYRPGAMVAKGFGPEDVARLRPGIVYASLSAYGTKGPWAHRRGFDSLVQTASGFNHAEALAAGQSRPLPFPVQMLDYASGYLMAFAVQVALARQVTEGGSWHVQVSLAQTAQWLRSLGRVAHGFAQTLKPINRRWLETTTSAYGQLEAVTHAAQFGESPCGWVRPSQPPGTDEPAWPNA